MAASSPASMAANRMSVAALCIATPAAGCILTPSGFVAVILFTAAIPDVTNPCRVIPAWMVDNVLLFVAQVGHVAGFGQPCAARVGAVLNLISGPNAGAGARVETGVPGIHCLNHLLIQA